MKAFLLGYVLFSKRVVALMQKDAHFARVVGDTIGLHLRGDSGKIQLSETQKQFSPGTRRSVYRYPPWEIHIRTELDKNKMPRTSVVFPDEGSCL